MLKKIKEFFAKRKEAKIQKEKLEKAKKYYEIVRKGATFIKFIYDDLEKKKSNMNRSQRRRWEKDIAEKGKFFPEIVQFYSGKIDEILVEIDKQLNPPKPGTVKIEGKKV